MDQAQFQNLAAEGYNRIPVYREVLSDLDTPLSVYLKLVDGPFSFLFESVQGGEQWARYSIIGLPARTVYKAQGSQFIREEYGEVVDSRRVDDPLAELESIQQAFKVPLLPELPSFCGGLVGYFGYECISYMEPRLADSNNEDQLGVPDFCMMLCDEVAVFDNQLGLLYLIVCVDPTESGAWHRANRRLDQLSHRLRQSGAPYPEIIDPASVAESDFISGFTREGFTDAVERCKEYIRAGDIMQVVLSQRLSVPFKAHAVDIYRALRYLNPSPYMFFLDLRDLHVAGASPEVLMRLEDGEVMVRPIAGTRPRGATPDEDAALEQELLADPKELAEHLMLIDLGRNDVGRVSETGGVKLTDQMVIERYSHVMHIVSEVRGRLRPDVSAIDALRATFPAGTLSGAPKIRAMEIIDELEPIKRNVYAGAVGYIGWNGNVDTCIAIRTAVIHNGQLHVQAGAGIVADSDPQREWEETMSKGRALFRAVAQAASGL
ncbi:MAG: anthranilate synthase component I [Xanthomonadales bacterium]|nr:anthranilate synthase component I [Xanthomonadales bacterium]